MYNRPLAVAQHIQTAAQTTPRTKDRVPRAVASGVRPMCERLARLSVAGMKNLVSAAVASVVVAAVLPAGADASWPGVNGRVSLTQRVPAGEVRANRDIFAYPLGTDAADARRRLTTSTNNEEQSSWSPDGQWIAFKQLDDVWVVRWDGTQLKQLTDFPAELNNTQPSWSADGKQIIFRSNADLQPVNVADIWVMNADGTDRRKLVTRDEGDERYPSMSPDGKTAGVPRRLGRDLRQR